MNRTLLRPATLMLATFVFAAAALITDSHTSWAQTPNKAKATTDVKIRQRMGTSGQGMETVLYIKGARMRSEMISTAMAMTNVRQCDLKRTIMINDKAKTYLIVNDGEQVAWGAGGAAEGDGGGVPAAATTIAQPPTQPRRGGVVNLTHNIADTGERKEMFGFTARRIKSSTVKEASPDACDMGSHKSETDGWYIDFQYDFNCPGEKKIDPASPVRARPDCQDEVRAKTIGAAKLGYPVLVTTTSYREGGRTSSMTQEVLELTRAPLDPTLFDVPAGYALAKNYKELYGMGDRASAGDGGHQTSSSTPEGSSVASISSAPSAAAAGFVSANAPKKEGAVRIGIVTPKAQMTSGNSAQAAEAVRNTLASFLNGPSIEVVSLTARLPSQALEEARLGQCDYVLFASLTQKKGGGGGLFGRALSSVGGVAVGHIPVNTHGEAVARSVAVSSIHTTANIAGSIKAKDELSLEYKLEAIDGAKQTVGNTAKGKAKSDGEDVLTPLIERVAEVIVAAATKK